MTPTPIDILLVEDNPGDVELTRIALESGKVLNNLVVAEDGEQAMKILIREPPFEDSVRPDLILLDLNLPRVGGHEVLAKIKADEKLRTIPVVVLTSSQMDADIEGSYRKHANCFITKPVDFQQFVQAVRSIEDFWFSVVRLPPAPTD